MDQIACGELETPRAGGIRWITVTAALILLRAAYWYLFLEYVKHLLISKQFTKVHGVLQNYQVGAATALFIELLVIQAILAVGRTRNEESVSKKTGVIWSCVIGSAAGILFAVLDAAAVPLPFRPFGLGDLLADSGGSSTRLAGPAILVLLLPFLAERVFRGTIFAAVRHQLGLTGAVVMSSLAFAYCWPLTDMVTAFLAGIIAAILYAKTGSLLPGIFTTLLATIICISILTWRALTPGAP